MVSFRRQVVMAVKQCAAGLRFTIAASIWTGVVLGVALLERRDAVVAMVAGAVTAACTLGLRRSPYRNAFVALAATLIGAMMTLEIALRLQHFGAQGVLHLSSYTPSEDVMSRGLVAPASDASLIYGMNPGVKTMYMGRLVTTNSAGFRGEEVPLERSPGVRRVVAVGSSITMGAGVEAQEAYPEVLEREWLRAGKRVEVLNAGIPAYPALLRLRLAESLVRRYRPDIVIVELSTLDASLGDVFEFHEQGPDHGVARESTLQRLSFALTALYPPADARRRLSAITRLGRAPTRGASHVEAESIEDGLVRLGQTSTELGCRVVVFFDRPLYELANHEFAKDVRRTLRDISDHIGARFIDSSDEFSAFEFSDELIVFPGDLHPNARAHERYAHAILRGVHPDEN